MIGFPSNSPAPSWTRRRPTPVLSRNGMVATAHPLASAAGLQTLMNGGNAVDAAISAALACTVVLPAMCGIGGDLFAIVADTKGDRPVAFLGSGIAPRGFSLADARERADPGGLTFAEHGPLAPSVPGFVSGVFSLLDRFGTKHMPELAAAAVGYAAEGTPVTPGMAKRLSDGAKLLERFETSKAIFLPGGTTPASGAMLKQPDLARSISAIANGGPEVFYKGAIAKEIARYLAATGGALTTDDFADHATVVEPAISSTYRGHTIFETGLPTQGFLLLEALNILRGDDIAGIGTSSAHAVHLMVEAMKRSFADRWAYCGDPAVVPDRLAALLSDGWAAKRRATIDERAASKVDAGELLDGDTTYLCAADGNGLMVSLIISLSGGFGSGVVAGDTGILLNNRAGHCFNLIDGHPNIYAPGKKTMHTLNCYLIADGSDRPVAVGGSPGGDFQPQWNLQMVTGLIDAGLDVQATVEQPRWTIAPGSYPREVGQPYELRLEERAGEETFAALVAAGHRLTRAGEWGGLGSAQIIARDPESGVLAGGSDPRAEGQALGF